MSSITTPQEGAKAQPISNAQILDQMPMQINNVEFAKKKHEINGTIASCQFSRLTDIIAGDAEGLALNTALSSISYHLTGELVPSTMGGEQPALVLTLKGCLSLKCQRCLTAMPYAVNIKSKFVVMPDIQATSPLNEDGYEGDDLEYLPADAQMSVLDLIEDELLLNLPAFPKHADGRCGELSAIKEIGKVNPFEALLSLKSST